VDIEFIKRFAPPAHGSAASSYFRNYAAGLPTMPARKVAHGIRGQVFARSSNARERV